MPTATPGTWLRVISAVTKLSIDAIWASLSGARVCGGGEAAGANARTATSERAGRTSIIAFSILSELRPRGATLSEGRREAEKAAVLRLRSASRRSAQDDA